LPFRFSGALLLLLFFTGSMVSLNRYYHDSAYSKTRGWRDLAETIEGYAVGLPRASVRIAQNFPDPTLWYYYDGPLEHVVLPPSPHDEDGAEAAVEVLVQDDVNRVILPAQPAPNWDDTGIAQAALAGAFSHVQETNIGAWPVHVYDRLPVELTATDVKFENGVEVASYGLQPETLNPGGVLSVRVDWALSDGRDNDSALDDSADQDSAKVTLQLLGPDGRVVAQHDRSLDAGRFSTSSTVTETYGMLMPEALASGDYRLIVALYLPNDSGATRILTAQGEDAATLQQFSHFPLTAPHTPIAPTSDFQGQSRAGVYGDFVRDRAFQSGPGYWF
jgi:hypothetical protein